MHLSVVLGFWGRTHGSLRVLPPFFVSWKFSHLVTKQCNVSVLLHHCVNVHKQTRAKRRKHKRTRTWFAHFGWVWRKMNKYKKTAVAEYWLHVTSKVPTLRGSRGTALLVLYWFKLIRSFFFFFWLLLVPWHNNLYKSSSCIFWGTPTSLWRPCCWRKQHLFDGPIRHLPLRTLFFCHLKRILFTDPLCNSPKDSSQTVRHWMVTCFLRACQLI